MATEDNTTKPVSSKERGLAGVTAAFAQTWVGLLRRWTMAVPVMGLLMMVFISPSIATVSPSTPGAAGLQQTVSTTVPASVLGTVSSQPAYLPSAVDPDGGGGGVRNCGTGPTGQYAQEISSSNWLPVNRWSGATNKIHYRLGNDFYEDTMQKVQRGSIDATMLMAGNTFWSWSVAMVEQANRFCVSESAGKVLDGVAARIMVGQAAIDTAGTGVDTDETDGTGLYGFGVIAGLAGIGIMMLLWQKSRGQLSWGKVGRFIGLLALISMMANGAAATTATSFGTWSPGWIMSNVNSTISTISSLPAAAFSSAAQETRPSATRNEMARNKLHCFNYTDALVNAYKQEYGSSYTAPMAAVPQALDGMWQTVGLQSYIKTQFGTKNLYGDMVFCNQLEYNAGTPPYDHALQLSDLGNSSSTDGSSLPNGTPAYGARFELDWDPEDYEYRATPSAGLPVELGDPDEGGEGGNMGSPLFTPKDNEETDMAVVSRAACTWDGSAWTGTAGWDNVANQHADTKRFGIGSFGVDVDVPDWLPGDQNNTREFNEDTSRLCAEMWNNGESMGDEKGGASPESFFNWPGNESDIKNGTPATDSEYNVQDFLLNYHGNATGNAAVVAFLFMLVSITMLIVFSLLAGAIIVAKAALLPMGLFVFFVALWDLLPFRNSSSRLVKFAKQYLGIAIFAFSASLILALVTLITTLLNAAGAEMGLGSIPAILWAGLCPVIAILMLKMLFSKVLKMPDPFSVKGATAYASSTGMMGDRAASFMNNTAAGLGNRFNPMTGGGFGRAGGRYGGAGAGGSYAGAGMGGMGRRGGMGLGGAAGTMGGGITYDPVTGQAMDVMGRPVDTSDKKALSQAGALASVWGRYGAGGAVAQKRQLRAAHAQLRQDMGGHKESKLASGWWKNPGSYMGSAKAAGANIRARALNNAAVRRQEMKDRKDLLAARFAEKPVRNSLKAAGAVGLGALAATTAMPAAVGVAGAIAAYKGAQGVKAGAASMSKGHREAVKFARDQRALAYFHAVGQGTAKESAEATSKGPKAGGDPTNLRAVAGDGADRAVPTEGDGSSVGDATVTESAPRSGGMEDTPAMPDGAVAGGDITAPDGEDIGGGEEPSDAELVGAGVAGAAAGAAGGAAMRGQGINIDTDGDGVPDAVAMDTDGDGRIDATTSLSGVAPMTAPAGNIPGLAEAEATPGGTFSNPVAAADVPVGRMGGQDIYVDTDGDGKPDMIVHDRNGDGTPDGTTNLASVSTENIPEAAAAAGVIGYSSKGAPVFASGAHRVAAEKAGTDFSQMSAPAGTAGGLGAVPPMEGAGAAGAAAAGTAGAAAGATVAGAARLGGQDIRVDTDGDGTPDAIARDTDGDGRIDSVTGLSGAAPMAAPSGSPEFVTQTAQGATATAAGGAVYQGTQQVGDQSMDQHTTARGSTISTSARTGGQGIDDQGMPTEYVADSAQGATAMAAGGAAYQGTDEGMDQYTTARGTTVSVSSRSGGVPVPGAAVSAPVGAPISGSGAVPPVAGASVSAPVAAGAAGATVAGSVAGAALSSRQGGQDIEDSRFVAESAQGATATAAGGAALTGSKNVGGQSFDQYETDRGSTISMSSRPVAAGSPTPPLPPSGAVSAPAGTPPAGTGVPPVAGASVSAPAAATVAGAAAGAVAGAAVTGRQGGQRIEIDSNRDGYVDAVATDRDGDGRIDMVTATRGGAMANPAGNPPAPGRTAPVQGAAPAAGAAGAVAGAANVAAGRVGGQPVAGEVPVVQAPSRMQAKPASAAAMTAPAGAPVVGSGNVPTPAGGNTIGATSPTAPSGAATTGQAPAQQRTGGQAPAAPTGPMVAARPSAAPAAGAVASGAVAGGSAAAALSAEATKAKISTAGTAATAAAGAAGAVAGAASAPAQRQDTSAQAQQRPAAQPVPNQVTPAPVAPKMQAKPASAMAAPAGAPVVGSGNVPTPTGRATTSGQAPSAPAQQQAPAQQRSGGQAPVQPAPMTARRPSAPAPSAAPAAGVTGAVASGAVAGGSAAAALSAEATKAKISTAGTAATAAAGAAGAVAGAARAPQPTQRQDASGPQAAPTAQQAPAQPGRPAEQRPVPPQAQPSQQAPVSGQAPQTAPAQQVRPTQAAPQAQPSQTRSGGQQPPAAPAQAAPSAQASADSVKSQISNAGTAVAGAASAPQQRSGGQQPPAAPNRPAEQRPVPPQAQPSQQRPMTAPAGQAPQATPAQAAPAAQPSQPRAGGQQAQAPQTAPAPSTTASQVAAAAAAGSAARPAQQQAPQPAARQDTSGPAPVNRPAQPTSSQRRDDRGDDTPPSGGQRVTPQRPAPSSGGGAAQAAPRPQAAPAQPARQPEQRPVPPQAQPSQQAPAPQQATPTQQAPRQAERRDTSAPPQVNRPVQPAPAQPVRQPEQVRPAQAAPQVQPSQQRPAPAQPAQQAAPAQPVRQPEQARPAQAAPQAQPSQPATPASSPQAASSSANQPLDSRAQQAAAAAGAAAAERMAQRPAPQPTQRPSASAPAPQQAPAQPVSPQRQPEQVRPARQAPAAPRMEAPTPQPMKPETTSGRQAPQAKPAGSMGPARGRTESARPSARPASAVPTTGSSPAAQVPGESRPASRFEKAGEAAIEPAETTESKAPRRGLRNMFRPPHSDKD